MYVYRDFGEPIAGDEEDALGVKNVREKREMYSCNTNIQIWI
jgi:hypothetical protein